MPSLLEPVKMMRSCSQDTSHLNFKWGDFPGEPYFKHMSPFKRISIVLFCFGFDSWQRRKSKSLKAQEGVYALLLALKMEGAMCYRMQVASTSWLYSETANKRKGPQSYNCRELNLVKTIAEFRSGAFPELPERKA